MRVHIDPLISTHNKKKKKLNCTEKIYLFKIKGWVEGFGDRTQPPTSTLPSKIT